MSDNNVCAALRVGEEEGLKIFKEEIYVRLPGGPVI